MKLNPENSGYLNVQVYVHTLVHGTMPPVDINRLPTINLFKMVLLSLLALVSTATASAIPQNIQPLTIGSDEPPMSKEDIVGGIPVFPEFKYPWMVSLQNSKFHFCGGSLLDANTIITAAHCSQRKPSSSLRVVAHRHNLALSDAQENALVFEVKSITNHPKYSSSNYQNDVSIWKINLISGNASDIPAGVVKFDNGTYSQPGTEMEVIGWGTTSSSGSASKILLTTKVPITTTEYCQKAYSNVSPTSICAGLPQGGKDTCQGDSGGPMFTTNESGQVFLVGLTSWGQGNFC